METLTEAQRRYIEILRAWAEKQPPRWEGSVLPDGAYELGQYLSSLEREVEG